MEEAKIGDFSRPMTRRPEPTAADKLDSAEERLAAEASKVEDNLKPMTSYEDSLKEAGVSKEKAAEIVDAVIEKGFYSEAFKVTPRLGGRLRTREYRDTLRLQRYLESSPPRMQTSYDETRYRYQLAASLEAFGPASFKFPDRNTTAEDAEKMFSDRLTFVENLPEATVNILFVKLERFNRKVFTCTQEGAIENF